MQSVFKHIQNQVYNSRFNFIYLQLRAKTFSWFGMQDPKEEAQVSRKRDDVSKEILAWRVKLRCERYSLLEFWKDIV